VLLPTLLGTALALGTSLLLAWKWKLAMGRTAVAVALLGVLAGLARAGACRLARLAGLACVERAGDIVVPAGTIWLLTLGAAACLLLFHFFRDPERTIPNAPHIIVSPADGVVLYVRESRKGILPVSTKAGRGYTLSELTRTPLEMNEAAVIGIGMSLLDVHVNRAPMGGRVVLTRHFPGPFGSLRRAEMVFRNERMTTVIERDGLQVAVVQIASRLVRQIVSFVKGGQELEIGQRIGAIRLGSQVDLVLPRRPDLRITVQVGERVVAGQSILATFEARCGANHETERSAPGSRRSSS
jgi:phosphatidylserine decarboxylase